jgi:hypothetical protein
MDAACIVEKFEALVAEGRDGFLLAQDGSEHRPEKGFAVGRRRFASARDAVEHLGPGDFLGFWRADDGETSVDVARVYQARATALLAALQSGQVCVYDFEHDESVPVDRLCISPRHISEKENA